MEDPHDELYRALLATKPRLVGRWARRNVVEFWLGRTVSVKPKFAKAINPHQVGTVIEVGVFGWVGIAWETDAVDGNWNRRELDDYQAGHHSKHRSMLLGQSASLAEIAQNLRAWDKKGRRRNGAPLDYMPG